MTMVERSNRPPIPAGLFNQGTLNSGLLNQHPTVFVDRDGVINRNRADHVLSWQDFQFEDGAIKALRWLYEAGYQVIVVTNQAVIDRGLLSNEALTQIHQQMMAQVREEGGKIEAVFHCPHRSEIGCLCRKPRPGLIYQAATQFNIELSQSWLIGDYLTDIEAGHTAGCKPILVLTGRGQEALKQWQHQKDPLDRKDSTRFLIKPNLLEAVEHILTGEHILL